jgi:hypothetical protein
MLVSRENASKAPTCHIEKQLKWLQRSVVLHDQIRSVNMEYHLPHAKPCSDSVHLLRHAFLLDHGRHEDWAYIILEDVKLDLTTLQLALGI